MVYKEVSAHLLPWNPRRRGRHPMIGGTSWGDTGPLAQVQLAVFQLSLMPMGW